MFEFDADRHQAERSVITTQKRRVRTMASKGDLLAGLRKLIEGAGGNASSRVSSSANVGSRVAFLSESAPSWDDLAVMVKEQESSFGLPTLNGDYENGPPTPFALKRTFGKSGEPKIKLYRDHAAWCPYVMLLL